MACLFKMAERGVSGAQSVMIRPFKEKLFRLTCEMYSIPYHVFTGEMYTRENKERPYLNLGGLSPREALIKVSEEIMKPAFGEDYFGKALVADIDEDITLVPDSGFMSEFIPVVERVGPTNVLVIKLFKDGCTFDNDSREYLDEDELFMMNVCTWETINVEGQQKQFEENIAEIVISWLERG